MLISEDKDRASRWALSAMQMMPEGERDPEQQEDITNSYKELSNLATTSRMVQHMTELELLGVQQQRSEDLDEEMGNDGLLEAVRRWPLIV